MTDLAIRSATRGDIPVMAKVVAAWEERTPWMHSAYSTTQIVCFFEEAFDNRVILVAGDPVMAYLALDPEQQRIGGLYSNVSGQGIGKALMDTIKVGRDYLWLTTHAPNLAAQKFYKREGFDEFSNQGAEPSNIVLELRMEWRR